MSRSRRTEVEWVNRMGNGLGKVPLPPGGWQELVLAPDGRSALASRTLSVLACEVWLFNSEGTKAERVSPREMNSGVPQWAPDGRSFVYSSNLSGRYDIYRQETGGAHAAELIPTVNAQFNFPCGFTPEGTSLVISAIDPEGAMVLLDGAAGWERRTDQASDHQRHESGSRSVSGRALAGLCGSGESLQTQVYVMSFPSGRQRVQVSTSGGKHPMWIRGGKEMLYLSSKGRETAVMSVPIEIGKERSCGDAAAHPDAARSGVLRGDSGRPAIGRWAPFPPGGEKRSGLTGNTWVLWLTPSSS